MAATLFRAAVPTPTSLVYAPPYPGMARRFENSTVTTSARGPNCSSFNGFKTCSSTGDYGSCLAGTAAASVCNCNNGMQYLDCVSAAIATSSCVGAVGISDWDAYQRNWFHSSCPTPESSVMTLLPQPTSVRIDLAPVATITPSGPISEPPLPSALPTYREGADMGLLEGDCSSTSYTLVNGGDMVFYAAFVGCNADRPQCCPWNVSTEAVPQGNRVAAAAGGFPIPASDIKDQLRQCPNDYYSVSGQCCPNGYYKFTRPIAYQTPCFSSLDAKATPPPITAGLAANPTNSALPTSAVVNVAWAMGFNTTGEVSSQALSKGAVVGIGVGAGVVAVVAAAAVVFFVLRSRKRKSGALAGADEQPGLGQGMTYQEGYHAPGGSMSPPPPHGIGKPVPSVSREYGGGAGGVGGNRGDWDGRYGYQDGYQGVQQQGGYEGGYRA